MCSSDLRRVAILGDMRELGNFEKEAHRTIGLYAVKRADVLITVGSASAEISTAAAKDMRTSRIVHFKTISEACTDIAKIIKSGDVILVKGSQGARMEKIVKALMAEPEKAGRFLIRQSADWLKR